MNAPLFLPSVEYPGAARRAGLAAVLVCSFGYYAARSGAPAASVAAPAEGSAPAEDPPSGRHVVIYNAAAEGAPASAAAADDGVAERIGRMWDRALGRKPARDDGSTPQDFAAALSGRADPASLPPDAAQAARDAKALGDLLDRLGIPSLNADVPVITDKKAPPLDEKTKQALLEEAAAGVAGPTIHRLVAEAEKTGALDLPLYGGRSLRQIRDHAMKLGAQADELAETRRKEQNEALGVPAGSDEPAVVVPQLVAMLQGGDGEKEAAAQQLIEVRFARDPAAADAIPALEALQRSGKPGSEFAELALKRIRFFNAKRALDAK